MKQYNSYHTSIKQLAKRNKLPAKFSNHIDRSTIWRWRNENDDKYLGTELSKIDLLEKFLERKESAKVIRTYLKLTTALSKILNSSSQFQKILSGNKEKFVRSILRYQKHINLKLVLRLCRISSSVFYHWKQQILYKCQPPLSDFAGGFTQILRNNIVNASLATWYNYIHKLGWERPKISKKSKYGIGIRANRPHQVWHADITIVKCLNGMKYYVYLLMDNFSRFILNYQVSENVSAKIRKKSIQHAYEQYIKVDGGIENNNKAVDDYINSDEVSVQKLIAGKDIKFSNSIVEAQNKIIKYRYLFKHDFKDIHELRKLLDWIINNYG